MDVTHRTEIEYEAYRDPPEKARIMVEIVVDGFPSGRHMVVTSPKSDVEDLFFGRATMAEVRRRWHLHE